MDALQELLAPYRDPNQLGKSLGVVLAVDDADVRRLLAAWETIPLPAWKMPRRQMPSEPRERWLWLWEGFRGALDTPDYLADLSAAARVAASVALTKWRAIVYNRLAFPDGSISDEANGAIAMYIAGQVERRRGGRRRQE